jgi:hypothetical protein
MNRAAHSDRYARQEEITRTFTACMTAEDFEKAAVHFEALAVESRNLQVPDVPEMWLDFAREARVIRDERRERARS